MSEEEKLNVTETALCIWEWVVENIRQDSHPPTAALIEDWRSHLQGTSSIRLECIDIAREIEEELRRISTDKLEGSDIQWSEPFDWEIIPRIMESYVRRIARNKFFPCRGSLRDYVWKAWAADQDAPVDDFEYVVHWSKTYIAIGKERVVANSAEAAEADVWGRIGDLTGCMHYDPHKDVVETINIIKTEDSKNEEI